MPEWGVALVALVCLIGIVGTIVPVLPGTLVVAGAIVVWALVEGGWTSWAVAIAAVAVIAVGFGLKYLIPGKWLSAAGVPWFTLAIGGVAGVVGFFVIPVVGVFVGFIVGVLAVELVRLRDIPAAWAATWAAMKASGLSMLIELASAMIATAIWAAGVYAL